MWYLSTLPCRKEPGLPYLREGPSGNTVIVATQVRAPTQMEIDAGCRLTLAVEWWDVSCLVSWTRKVGQPLSLGFLPRPWTEIIGKKGEGCTLETALVERQLRKG